jgi:hypothetical protein
VPVPLNNARKKKAPIHSEWSSLCKDNGSDRVAIVWSSQLVPIITGAKRLFRVLYVLDTTVVECAGSHFLQQAKVTL